MSHATKQQINYESFLAIFIVQPVYYSWIISIAIMIAFFFNFRILQCFYTHFTLWPFSQSCKLINQLLLLLFPIL